MVNKTRGRQSINKDVMSLEVTTYFWDDALVVSQKKKELMSVGFLLLLSCVPKCCITGNFIVNARQRSFLTSIWKISPPIEFWYRCDRNLIWSFNSVLFYIKIQDLTSSWLVKTSFVGIILYLAAGRWLFGQSLKPAILDVGRWPKHISLGSDWPPRFVWINC